MIQSVVHAFGLLYRYRSRLREGAATDIRQRYAGSVIGMTWAILYPLFLLTIYSVIYLMIFKVRPVGLDEVSYVVLVFSGLVPLLAFNEALIGATSSLITNRNLLLNTVFPAELIPVRAVVAGQFPSSIALLITLIGAVVLERTDWHAIVMIPVLWVLLLMFVTGIGWMLSLLVLVVRDIQQALGLVLMVLTILSPFAYTPDMVPPDLKFLLYFNPLSYFVLSFQQVICYGQWPSMDVFLPTIGLAFASFGLGYFMFRKTKHVFFDYA